MEPQEYRVTGFRRVLPFGETEDGGWRDATLLQFYTDYGQRTVQKSDIVRVR